MPCSKSEKRRSRAPEAIALALLVAACGPPERQEKAVDSEPVAPLNDAQKGALEAEKPHMQGPSLASPLRWEASSSGEGNAIVLFEDDSEILRIACLREVGLWVQTPRFKHVASEERMSVGAGDVVVTLVATGSPAGNPPVRGEGPIDPAFVRAVGEGRKIAVNYGYQNIGPFEGPPEERAKNFQAGCEGGGG
ncbi:MAG TPA: hypothetical protein VD906_02105 [Caulobacteraceae bacterium]|nr:hypothetical protein [Caulobacteraceae bacterium]